MKHEIWELKQMQSMPLDIKIKMTETRIRDWYDYWGGEVYVSFSGGKDSTVLLDIVRRLYPDVEAVFVNTGLEYPEIQSFVKTFDNVRILYPKKSFSQVITEYGYPILSKVISHQASIAKRFPEGNVAKNFFFHPNPQSKFSLSRYVPLLQMDFNVSSNCCDVLKKSPSHLFSKQCNKKPITAQMACESRLRTQIWLDNGCNAFESKNPICNPLSFWTEQDVLQYINFRGLKIASVYGEIVPENDQITLDPDCNLKTSGCSRTGCIFCGFGCHLEKVSRFQSLRETHPKQYNYCIFGGQYNDEGVWIPSKDGLGLGHVFDELNKVYGDNFIRY